MNEFENGQQVRHFNPNYISFSLNRMTKGQARIPESTAGDANPPTARSTEHGFAGFQPQSSHQC